MNERVFSPRQPLEIDVIVHPLIIYASGGGEKRWT